jgi:membrane protein DedA with SNARE-associated domain
MDPRTWDAPFGLIVGALFVIVMLRANGTYWLGRLLAAGAHRTRAARLMDSPGYVRAVGQINRWGAPVVTVSFLTIGIQTLVNMAAGGTRMPLTRYLPAVTVGCVIWALLYGTIGLVGFEAALLLWQTSPVVALVVLGVLAAGAAGWFVVRARTVRRAIPTPE